MMPYSFPHFRRFVGVFASVTFALLSSTIAANFPLSYVSSALPTYSYRAFPADSSLTLTLAVTPVPGGTLQWLHDDQPIPAATATSLTLPALSATDAGNYRVRITDGTTVSFSETFTVNVLPPNTNVVDPSFTSELPDNFWVASVTGFANDGSFIVQSSGTTPPLPIRLAANGSIISGFNYPASAGAVLTIFPDGRLITEHAPYLLAADGSALPFTLPAGFTSTKPLSGAAITGEGKFYVSQDTKIVRFLANGTIDPAFNFTASSDVSSTTYAVDSLGRLFVKGRRSASNPSNFPSSWDVIYRLHLDGTFDVDFSQPSGVFQYGSARIKVVPLADGRIFHWSAYHGYYDWRMHDEQGAVIANWSGGIFTDYTITVDPDHNLVYVPQGGGVLKRYRLTSTGLEEDTAFFAGVTAGYSLPPFVVTPEGELLISTQTASWEGHPTQGLARLRTDLPIPLLPPLVGVAQSSYLPTRGSTLTFTAQVSGNGPYTYQWLALDGQPLPATTTSANLVIANFSAANFGRYQLRVNGSFGTVLSSVVELGLNSTELPYLANLSGRAVPGPGEDATIAGFSTRIYAGALGVPLLIRGVGPALKELGVSQFLPNPALNLYNASGTLIGNNDNWGASADRDTIRAHASSTGAFALAENSLDAGLLKTSSNERFTVHLFNQTDAGAPGAGLLEIYRVPNALVAGELTNLSLRAHSGSGDATAIAGFVIADPQGFDRPAKVLLRAIGPTLAQSGIVHPLANPVLTVYNSKGEVVAQNDDWPSHLTAEVTAFEEASAKVGAFSLPYGSKDSGLLLDLPAGAYSMHATGGSGVVLLEIYLVR